MRKPLRAISVIRKQEQPLRWRVSAPDVEKPWKFSRQQIENCVASMGIGTGRDESRGLVQHECEALFGLNKFAVDFDMVALIRLRAEIGAHLAVDRHPPAGDEFVAFAAGR